VLLRPQLISSFVSTYQFLSLLKNIEKAKTHSVINTFLNRIRRSRIHIDQNFIVLTNTFKTTIVVDAFFAFLTVAKLTFINVNASFPRRTNLSDIANVAITLVTPRCVKTLAGIARVCFTFVCINARFSIEYEPWLADTNVRAVFVLAFVVSSAANVFSAFVFVCAGFTVAVPTVFAFTSVRAEGVVAFGVLVAIVVVV